jgi:transcriptional regulator with XRE-family HTH domain
VTTEPKKSVEGALALFRERLIALREARGWSQSRLGSELAALLGREKPVAQTTVSRWESEQPGWPDAEELLAMAALLDTTMDYLLGRSGERHGLPAGHFLVDLDTYELLREGREEELPPGRHGWYAVVPRRHVIVDSDRYAVLDRALPTRHRRRGTKEK